MGSLSEHLLLFTAIVTFLVGCLSLLRSLATALTWLHSHTVREKSRSKQQDKSENHRTEEHKEQGHNPKIRKNDREKEPD